MLNMKNKLKVMLLVFVSTASFFMNIYAVNAPMPMQTSATQALQSALSHYKTFRANFDQVVYDEHGQVIQRSHGRMMMERPGKFRWETLSPTHTVVVTNGVHVWNYNVDLMQATEQPLQKGKSLNPASLLTGTVQDLNAEFTISYISQTSTGALFKITPNAAHDNFKQVKIKFQNDKLTSMAVTNQLNQTSVFDFSDIRVNTILSPSYFNFQAPKGVQVIQQKSS